MIIEIGTSDFDTEAGKQPGLFIEPVKEYFDKLPDSCWKENAAVSNYEGETSVYYIPSDLIIEHNLPPWVRGCNSINKVHPTIQKHGWAHLAVAHNVRVTTLCVLLSQYNINNIDVLKVDTEGHDCVILNNFLDTIQNKPLLLPKVIKFEANILQTQDDITQLVDRLRSLDYNIENEGDNVIAKRKDWINATKWECDWWSDCTNTLYEEIKQKVYAAKMGLRFVPTHKTPYNIMLDNLSVVDVGGGPCSLLLKSLGGQSLTVLDPCKYPDWVVSRYKAKGIEFVNKMGEDSDAITQVMDECWCYNVLQHTNEPSVIAQNMRKWGKLIRVFEWINTPISHGHIHTLTSDKLNEWFGGIGKVEKVNEGGCIGTCWHGIFVGNNK